MKRFIGYILAALGTAGTLLGAYHVAIGESEKRVIGEFKALYVGLAGVAMLVLGLTMARD